MRKLSLPESQIVHGALPPERHMLASRRVLGFPGQLPGRIPAGPGLLCERAATRVERSSQTH